MLFRSALASPIAALESALALALSLDRVLPAAVNAARAFFGLSVGEWHAQVGGGSPGASASRVTDAWVCGVTGGERGGATYSWRGPSLADIAVPACTTRAEHRALTDWRMLENSSAAFWRFHEDAFPPRPASLKMSNLDADGAKELAAARSVLHDLGMSGVAADIDYQDAVDAMMGARSAASAFAMATARADAPAAAAAEAVSAARAATWATLPLPRRPGTPFVPDQLTGSVWLTRGSGTYAGLTAEAAAPLTASPPLPGPASMRAASWAERDGWAGGVAAAREGVTAAKNMMETRENRSAAVDGPPGPPCLADGAGSVLDADTLSAPALNTGEE